jgi:hypothetical protein
MPGVHHVAFEAPSRDVVDERHRWLAERGAEIENEPRLHLPPRVLRDLLRRPRQNQARDPARPRPPRRGMTTTPPEQQGTPSSRQYGFQPGTGNAFATLPIPGNAELVVFVLVDILFAIITLASDSVDAGTYVTATAAITFAYLLSRGIAKASRVLEQ